MTRRLSSPSTRRGNGIKDIHSSGKEGSMKKRVWLLILLAWLMTSKLVMAADTPAGVDAPPIAPPPPDIVTLKDGSVIYGEVIGMEGGILLIKTDAAADKTVKLNWANGGKLAINHTIPFHLREGSVLIGTATDGPHGTLNEIG